MQPGKLLLRTVAGDEGATGPQPDPREGEFKTGRRLEWLREFEA